jgi:hypothetical protein
MSGASVASIGFVNPTPGEAIAGGTIALLRRLVPHGASLTRAYLEHLEVASPADVAQLNLQPARDDVFRSCQVTAAALAWVLSGRDVFLPFTFDWDLGAPGFGEGVRLVAGSSDGDEFGNAVDHVALFVGESVVFDSHFGKRTLEERVATVSLAEDFRGLHARHLPLPVDAAAAELRTASIGFVEPTLNVPVALVDAAKRWKAALAGASGSVPSLAPDKQLLFDAFGLLQRKLPRHEVLERAEVLGAGVKAVRLVFKTREDALGFVVLGLRLARHHLTLPRDFVERTFAHQTRGWSALEAALVVATVAHPPPGAPAREPGDTFVYFRVDLPDDAGPCFVAWFCKPPDAAKDEKQIRDALMRFTEVRTVQQNLLSWPKLAQTGPWSGALKPALFCPCRGREPCIFITGISKCGSVHSPYQPLSAPNSLIRFCLRD